MAHLICFKRLAQLQSQLLPLCSAAHTTAGRPSLRHCSTAAPQMEIDERFEPPYINSKIPKVGKYPLININMKGYDYMVLQSYQKWVDRTARDMGLTVKDRWAVPCQSFEITRLKTKSSVVDDTYKLNLYERYVQLSDLPSTSVVLLLELLQAALPEGVLLHVDHHNTEVSKNRFLPDLELKKLREEYDNVGVVVVRKFVKKTKDKLAK